MIKKRDAAATRQNIIDAAQQEFAQRGYDGAGLREIAKNAGINVALINRYFGSKEGLFEQSVMPHFNIDDLLDGDKSGFGKRIAEQALAKTIYTEGIAPNIAFIRSVGSAQVKSQLKEGMESQIIMRLANWLGGQDAEQRAALIVSQLLGFALLHSVVGVDALETEHTQAITDRLANVLQSYVDDAG